MGRQSRNWFQREPKKKKKTTWSKEKGREKEKRLPKKRGSEAPIAPSIGKGAKTRSFGASPQGVVFKSRFHSGGELEKQEGAFANRRSRP